MGIHDEVTVEIEMTSVFSRIIKDIFVPPYRYLPLAVFAYAVLCFILHPHGALRTGYLADTDDYMRLNEAINWLGGQGWHDLSHPRLSPGAHTVVHWARLLDLPLALLMLPLIPVMGMQNAALLASFIVPPATFGILLWLSTSVARIFVGAERANLAAPLTLFAPLMMMNFVPGRVDHHGYEILVAGFGLLCLERMVADDVRRGNRMAILAAIVFACGLWIGTEALPWVLLFIGCLAVLAAWYGGALLGRAAVFGVAFFASTLAVLPLAVAPADYSSLALSWYSTADVILAALVMAMFVAAYCTGKWLKAATWPRVGLMAVLGIAAALAFFMLVPHAIHGPFADYDDFDSTIALASIGEAQPLIQNFRFNIHNPMQIMAACLSMVELLLLPVVALIATGFAAYRASSRKRSIIMAHGIFLGAALLLALFWQMRVGWFMQFFTIAPLTYLLVKLWEKIAQRFAGRRRFVMEITAFCAIGFFPVILIPAVAHDAPVLSDVILFPAARTEQACPMRTTADFLNASWGLGDRTHTILASGNEGPELLFRTHHNVIAANFNVAGNEDVYNFFGARDDDEAKAIMNRWHADLVLICRAFPLGYARLAHAQLGRTAFLSEGDDGKLRLVSNPLHPTLIERLAHGPVPSWLKPVEIPAESGYLLFEKKEN